MSNQARIVPRRTPLKLKSAKKKNKVITICTWSYEDSRRNTELMWKKNVFTVAHNLSTWYRPSTDPLCFSIKLCGILCLFIKFVLLAIEAFIKELSAFYRARKSIAVLWTASNNEAKSNHPITSAGNGANRVSGADWLLEAAHFFEINYTIELLVVLWLSLSFTL